MANGERICVNRLLLFRGNKIEKDCPLFVIDFLARSLSVDLSSHPTWNTDEKETSKIIRTIETTLEDNSFQIDVGSFDKNLRELASFVNPDCVEWSDRQILFEAFWDAYKFNPKIPLKVTERFGPKTPDTPFNIDVIMAYQICLQYGIPTRRETIFKEVEDEITLLCTKLTPIREDIFTRISRLPRRGLISLRNHLAGGDRFVDKAYPSSNEEAIRRAALEYRWDVSLSENPIKEFIEMDRLPDDSYQPIDQYWKRIFNSNRHYFHLDSRYMKQYNSMYSKQLKDTLVYRNGGSEDSDYLVFGIHPVYIKNKKILPNESGLIEKHYTTIEYLDIPIDALSRSRNLISSPDFVCYKEELGRYWNQMKVFIFPHDRSKEFSRFHLKMICNNAGPGDPLVKTIELLQKEQGDIMDNGFFELFHLGRDKAISILKEVLDLGYKMRGHGVCYNDPPLKESLYDIEKYQEKIETNVVEKAIDVKDKYEEILDKIPLMTGRSEIGQDDFKITLYGENITLGHIIRLLFQTEEVSSCIRTNSNYFLLTSWYFLNRFKEKVFPIEEMKFIF